MNMRKKKYKQQQFRNLTVEYFIKELGFDHCCCN